MTEVLSKEALAECLELSSEAKMESVKEYLSVLIGRGSKMVVVAHHEKVLDTLVRFFQK